MIKKIFTLIVLMVVIGVEATRAAGPKITYNFVQGLNYVDLGDYPQALKFFTAEIDNHRSNAYAYLWRGKTHFEMGNYNEAMADVNHAIAKLPKKDKTYRSFAHSMRGKLYLQSGDCSRAVDELSSAIELMPEMGEIYVSRAEAEVGLDHYSAAIDDLVTAIDKGYVNGIPRVVRLLVSAAGPEKLSLLPQYATLVEKLSGVE